MMKSIYGRHKQIIARNIYPRGCASAKHSNDIIFIFTRSTQLVHTPAHHTPHHILTPSCRRGTSFASDASYSVDDCPYRAFAKKHPEAARRVLTVPPFSDKNYMSTKNALHAFSYSDVDTNEGGSQPVLLPKETLENYLQWRGWNIEGILQEYKLGDDLLHSAVGLLSHTLTFPLTLGRYAKAFHSPSFSEYLADGKVRKDHNFRRCCVVGARAECTLPDEFWKEFHVATMPISMAHNDRTSQHTEEPFHFIIDFVGPDVPSHLKSKTISLGGDGESSQQNAQKCVLTMNYHTSFLHEVVLKFLKSSHATSNGDIQSSSNRTEQIRQFWDGFVLFNPGLGHPNLAAQWKPTLKFLIGTGKPILFTAHSTVDAERDRVVIEEELLVADRGGSVEYNINPFASRMGFVDPITSPGMEGVVHVVRPNDSTFLLR
ncbi:hypothetical protein ACHAXR_001944 [Thalassiosira sp. AJA248-18]